jgi:peptidyl-prolyl cis-trans isomerase B (cyclophilin B)
MTTLKPLILALSILFASLFGLHTLANETGNKNMIRMTTSLGDIDIELYPDDAPETVRNFISYVEGGHFDGLVFHRVIPGFMIQGGGFTPDMKQRETQPPIKNEADNGLKNLTGTLSMARTSVPDSATSQFFINLVDNGFLDYTAKTQQGWGYAVFAKVVEGMDVVRQIGGVATGNVGGHGDVPLEPVYIEKAEVISN